MYINYNFKKIYYILFVVYSLSIKFINELIYYILQNEFYKDIVLTYLRNKHTNNVVNIIYKHYICRIFIKNEKTHCKTG